MVKLKTLFYLIVIIFIYVQFSYGSDPGNPDSLNNVTPLTDIGTNFINSYTGWNSLYHIGAIGFTYISVKSGLDAEVLRITSGMDPQFCSAVGHTGLFLGYITPIILPATMYFTSKNNRDLRIASYAVMQSVAVTVAVGSFLKAITGREGPDPDSQDKDALSKNFKFGFMQGGLHYGWPSGHLMVNTAVATTLAAYYSEKTWVRNLAYGYIVFLTFSMIIHDRGSAHWFSDIIAGGLMGIAFGTTIGNDFRSYRYSNDFSTEVNNNHGYSMQLHPCLSPDYTGIVFNIGF